MAKKCIICSGEATLVIKGTNDFYCQSCAEEHFDDVSCLQSISQAREEIESNMDKTDEDDGDIDPGEMSDD